MISVVMLTVFKQNAIVLSVVAPFEQEQEQLKIWY
jgi:hypothetical protein